MNCPNPAASMKLRHVPGLVAGTVRHRRGALLCGTALQAASVLAFLSPAFPIPAFGQLALGAHPTGGQVVAGSAAIGQTTAQTTVTQSSLRAAIEWQSFDVGRQHLVQFSQPSSSAVTLNRVTGPDPSQIAGQIIANGNIIITNRSGVVFHQGAQVNANSLIASAPGITNQNFSAGRMVFDVAPRPGARVANAGTITVKQAGLAALVAPQVANSGTINARLGRVVLAGAEAHTIDLYGDGLVAIDVTKQVSVAPRGRGGRPLTALVTNTGTIVADGGSVLLTAQAADGIVQNLVSVGGNVQAESVGDRRGTITIAGVGGSIRIEGRVAADGPGGPAGTIAIAASETVMIAPNARISANGVGGGTIALGTSVARALAGRQAVLAHQAAPGTPSGTARRVIVTAGAIVSADGSGGGSGGGGGGTVAVLSRRASTIEGKLTARGAPNGGDGGVIETSSDGVLALHAAPDAGAPRGKPGTLFIDPYDLLVTSNPPTGATQATLNGSNSVPPDSATAGTSYITPQTLTTANNNGATSISLYANHDLTVQSAVNLSTGMSSTGGSVPGASLLLNANHDLTITAPVTLAATATLTLQAGNNIALQDALTAATVSLTAGAAITQSNGAVTANTLTGSAGSVALTSTTNRVAALGAFAATGGFALADASGLVLNGAVSAGTGQALSLASDSIGFSTGASLSAPGGTVTLAANTPGGAFALTSAASGPLVSGALQVGSLGTGSVSIGGAFDFSSAGSLTTIATGAVSADSGSSIQVRTLTGQAGSARFLGTNMIATLGNFAAGSAFTLNDGQALTLSGTLTAAAVSLTASGAIVQTGGLINATSLTGSAASASFGSSGNTIASLGTFTTSGGFTLVDSAALVVSGAVSAGTVSIGGGQTLSLASDSISVGSGTSTGGGLSAPGGTVVLQPFTAGQPFTLDAARLPTGSVSASTLQVGNATAGPVTLSGNFTFNSVGTLDLRSAGAVSQGALDAITVAALTGQAGSVSLPGGNQIGTLGTVTTSAGFSLSDAQALSVVGPVQDAQSVAIIATGGLTIAGSITAPVVTLLARDVPGTSSVPSPTFGTIAQTGGSVAASTLLSLTADGGISQSGGTIAAGTLTGSTDSPAGSGGNGRVSLNSAGNLVTTLGSFTSPGGFALTDAEALTVGGPVTAGAANSSGVIALTTAAGLTLAGSLTAASITVTAVGDITQPAGSLVAGTLGGSAASADLTAAGNQIATLGSFTTTGGFSLADATAVSLAGRVSVGTGQTLSIASDRVGYGDGGRLAAPGGTVALAPYTAGAGFALSTYSNTSNITASTLRIGSLTAGALSVTGVYGFDTIPTLELRSGGAITQTATSSIRVGTLTGEAGSASLTGANQVGALGAFSTAAGFSLADVSNLAVTGAVSAGSGQTLSLASDSIGLGTGGSLAAPGGTVALAPNTAGAAFALPSFASGSSVTATTLRIGSATTGAVTISGRYTFGNVSTLDLRSGDAIGEDAASSIQVGTLTGQAASARLAGPNQIGTLGGFTTGGDFTMVDSVALAVTGPVTAGGAAALTAAGAMAISGDITAPTLALLAGGAITQPSGTVSVGTLTGRAVGSATFGSGGAASVATLGQFFVVTSTGTTGGTGGGTSPSTSGGGGVTFARASAGGPTTTYPYPYPYPYPTTTAPTPTSPTSPTSTSTSNPVADPGDPQGPATPVPIATAPAGSALSLLDQRALTVTGPLSAGTITITAPGALTLAGSSVIADEATFQVTPGTASPSLTSPSLTSPSSTSPSSTSMALTQTGTTTIAPLSVGTGQLTLGLASGGTVSLAQLNAPSMALTLNLGRGSASGALAVAALQVSGSGGGAALTGSVGGQSGSAAAASAQISPAVDAAYVLDGCVIGVGCAAPVIPPPINFVRQPPQTVTTLPPTTFLISATEAAALTPKSFLDSTLGNILKTNLFTVDLISIGILRDPSDPELLLPNISDRDY